MRLLAPVLALLFCIAAAQAQEPQLRPPARKPLDRTAPVTISADRMEGYANQETSASGNAELHQDDRQRSMPTACATSTPATKWRRTAVCV